MAYEDVTPNPFVAPLLHYSLFKRPLKRLESINTRLLENGGLIRWQVNRLSNYRSFSLTEGCYCGCVSATT